MSEDKALCHDPNHTPRWGMTIDVNRCVGCQTCTIACKHWNATMPGVQWRRVIDIEQGEYPDVERLFLVVGCQHCAEPPCVPVCPTGATKQRADGLVTMDYDTCIGCGYCAVACPYQARTIAHDQHYYYGDDMPTVQEEQVFDQDRLGVAQKCTFCMDRVDAGLDKGLTPGVDPEATPACSSACIASAIKFGDFNDPDSPVSKLIAEKPYFQMHEDLGTDPQIKYLYTTPAVPGAETDTRDDPEDRQRDLENPLVGQRQTFWDWRAAMNWCFGGLSSGFAFLAWLVFLSGGIEPVVMAWMNFGAAALMSVGLFFVFLKIGRKLRFHKAIRRPHTSWMTRELYVVAVFFPMVLLGLFWQSHVVFAIAGLSALAFLWCQAKILHMAKGIPNWRAPLIPPMIVASGLLEGFGLLLAAGGVLALTATGILGAGVSLVYPFVALILIATNFGLWTAYRKTAQAQGIPPLSRDRIESATMPLHVLGHAAPAILIVAAILVPAANIPLFVLAGLAMVAGGFYWKFTVIVRAAYQQGFAMPVMPHRGSGARAAPPRLDGYESRPINIRQMAAE